MKVFVKVNKQGNIETIDIERIESFYDVDDLKAFKEARNGKNIKSLKHVDLPVTHRIYQSLKHVDLPVTHRIYQRKFNNNNKKDEVKHDSK